MRLLVTSAALLAACSATGTGPVRFDGTFYANEAESTLLPDQRLPKDFVAVIKDDGELLQTTQTFTTASGHKVRYVWNGLCDGQFRPVEGVDPPGTVILSCQRTHDGALINTLADNHGYSHVETCSMTADRRKQVCKGTATLPDGTKHDFVYAFDRKM
jgi:hypothetical protein